MRLVIVTGMSGAGKTSALKMLEDLGFYCVDNLPIPLMEAFVELVMQKPAAHEEVALGIDIRSGEELPQLEQVLENWKAQQVPYEILFLDSSDATLVKRYKETRRSHPLAGKGRVDSGIQLEREKLDAFWRGDAKREQMTRIYGISFPKKKMLDEYLVILEEAKKRDHRKIGKEMELFMFSERVGKGLPIWLPKGTQLRLRLQELLRSLLKPYNYQEVICPGIGGKSLYVTSGHYAHYGKDAFQPIQTPEEDEEYMLKPMNCPHHCEIYARKPRSYKDLPLRIAEFGTVFRYEKSGELHGLTRVRTFTQDDAHIFVRPEQVKAEFENVIDVILKVFKIFGFENYEAQISLRDPKDTEKYIGSDEIWEESENAIREACKEKGLETREEIGEAAFYGPKLDFMVKDAIGRRWQLGTIQVDYNLPERFKLEYTAEDNSKKTPVMIHRAPFGSLERFTAVLIEHTAGHFPLWLTPDQVAILPISEKFNDYAQKVRQYFDKQGVRALVDDRNEKIGRKIRDNELKRVPYMVIVGEKESAEGLVSMRKQGGGEQATMSMEEFAQRINAEVAEQLKAAEE